FSLWLAVFSEALRSIYYPTLAKQHIHWKLHHLQGNFLKSGRDENYWQAESSEPDQKYLCALLSQCIPGETFHRHIYDNWEFCLQKQFLSGSGFRKALCGSHTSVCPVSIL